MKKIVKKKTRIEMRVGTSLNLDQPLSTLHRRLDAPFALAITNQRACLKAA